MHIYHFQNLPSTQNYLLNHPETALAILCIAEEQNQGIGQREAKWHSPKGNLYFSLRYNHQLDIALYSGITQAIALALAETLDPKAEKLRIKWPNDLYLAQKKCAGILTHVNAKHLIIGIGINIAEAPENFSALNQHFPKQNPRDILKKILPPLQNTLKNWQHTPYLPLNNRWQDYDLLYQQQKILTHDQQSATLLGIDQKGRLIALKNKKLHFLQNTRIMHP